MVGWESNTRETYIGLLEQRLLSTMTMTLTVATRMAPTAQVGHDTVPRILVHGVDRAPLSSNVEIRWGLLEATQQALEFKSEA